MDMLTTIIPKSDQLNSDDLIGKTLTIKITDISIVMGDQPVAFHYQDENGKPYKPSKGMRRVIVNAWGSNANVYIGRSLKLYRDDKVSFGGMAVGGIRISHMSHIDKSFTMALTLSRAIRKPFTVNPLVIAEEKKTISDSEISGLKYSAELEAAQGIERLKSWWVMAGGEIQKSIGGVTFLDHLKAIAALSERKNSMIARLSIDLEAVGTDDYEDLANSQEFKNLLKEIEAFGNEVMLGELSAFIK